MVSRHKSDKARPLEGCFSFIQLAALRTTVWTPRPSARYRSAMARRSVFDPLEPTSEPRWYVVRNMHRAVLEARALAPGVNLKRAFVAGMLEHIDAGWQLGEFSSTGAVFFCTKGVERRMVEISPSDPGPRAGRNGR
jgi:hypothetical protein